jgi:serine/threonine protein kinase
LYVANIVFRAKLTLNVVHSKNIAHGNLTGVSITQISFITPIIDATKNNILIDEKGNAFVADHGILAFCYELSGTSYITSNVRWTAPENFRISEDEEPTSSPQLVSDVYSFGCIMLQVRG